MERSENGAQRRRASRINKVWSCDFVIDQTEDGRRLKWLPVCDEFSRESVALEVERSMESADAIRILERGTAPEFIRSDHRPKFRRTGRAGLDWKTRVQDPLHRPWQPMGDSLQ